MVRNDWISTALLALLLGGLLYVNIWQATEVTRMAREVLMEVGELKTQWVSGGQTRSVTTARNVGESVADWQKRHFDAVVARMEQYPPDEE